MANGAKGQGVRNVEPISDFDRVVGSFRHDMLVEDLTISDSPKGQVAILQVRLDREPYTLILKPRGQSHGEGGK